MTLDVYVHVFKDSAIIFRDDNRKIFMLGYNGTSYRQVIHCSFKGKYLKAAQVKQAFAWE